ncbi:MAG: Sir2 family NAD-dependent protein deacetylase [Acidobacteriota bacterium]
MARADASLEDFAAAWRRAERAVVLTGAGLSTASGIPDFRSPGGRWSQYQPVTIQEFEHSHASREEYWRYKGETWEVIEKAEPNAGHISLAELAVAGKIQLLVTQNIDGLHGRSGFPADRTVTIHGTDAATECLECGRREPRAAAQEAWAAGESVPTCRCGGWLKPATIAFGQQLVMADLKRAFEASERCDLFVAVGTSLVVSPINHTFLLAAQAGAGTAILTASETPFDDEANWRSTEPLEELLPRLRDLILA